MLKHKPFILGQYILKYTHTFTKTTVYVCWAEILKTNEEYKNDNNDYDNKEIEEESEIQNKEEDE